MNFLASPWIPLVVLIMLALAARFYQRSWLAPSAFAPLIWSFFIAVPLIVAPEYQVSGLAVWLILLLIVSTMIGAIVGEGAICKSQLPRKLPDGTGAFILRLTVFLSVLGFAGALYSAVKAINEYSLDFSGTSFLAVGHLLSVERYSGEQTPFLVRILVMWIFPAALLGGISHAVVTSRRQRILCFLPLFPAFLFSLFQAAKANTLIAVVLGLSGYMAMKVCLNVQKSGNKWRQSFLVGIICLAAGLSFFFMVDALRSHTEKETGVEIVPDWERAKSTAVGYLPVFSHWVDSPEGPNTLHASLGIYTLGGIFDVLGVRSRDLGVYTESVPLSGKQESNIYTAFRGVIEDFSLAGSILFFLALGFVSAHTYNNSRLGTSVPILVAFYSFILWSPVGSIYVYNGPILAFLVAYFSLHIAVRSKHSIVSLDAYTL